VRPANVPAPISDAETRHTLSPLEASELESLEQRYEVIQTTVFEGIGILLEIRDRRLYRAGYRTFEDYCRERWGLTRSRAYQLMEAAETVGRLSTFVDTPLPRNEGQARALARFDDDLQPAIMRATKAHADATGKPVTAGLVEGVGRVITEAATTGHVDIGDGTSTPILAAIVAESFEHTQRQNAHIREHYRDHDASGHRHAPKLPRQVWCKYCREPREVRWHDDGSIYVCVACTHGLGTRQEIEAEGADAYEWSLEAQSRPHVTNNSGENEWYTPPEYIDAARSVMGDIDLDPASSDFANRTIKAKRYHTMQDDGLVHAWAGRVWMNPPYSGDLVGRFITKLCQHLDAAEVTQAVVLVNNATETAWFQSLLQRASAVCFPKGRIRYLDRTGQVKQSPLQGQAFVYFGPDRDAFSLVFSRFGEVR
jgi:phage N-6-adenine-methyltransferase